METTTIRRAWSYITFRTSSHTNFAAMSYYFTIIGTRDNPLFEHEFGTSKPGGDGTAKFREEAAHMNQFIVHAALDMVEEVQWGTKDL
jgi:hypothetical protein